MLLRRMLTTNEAKAIIHLLEEKDYTLRDYSKLTGVPLTTLYDVITRRRRTKYKTIRKLLSPTLIKEDKIA